MSKDERKPRLLSQEEIHALSDGNLRRWFLALKRVRNDFWDELYETPDDARKARW